MSALNYHPPAQGLRDFISVYYLFHSEGPLFVGIERAALAQLRWAKGGTATMYFHSGDRVTLKPGWAVYGPSSSAVEMHIKGGMQTFGFGILPAGWATLFNCDASSLLDQVTAPAMLNAALAEAMKAVEAATSLEAMAAAADAVLLDFTANGDPHLVAFTRLIDGWLADNIAPDVQELQRRAALSPRQLTRKVKALYGVPPKYLARKYRALKAARLLANPLGDDIDFLRDAFYDQSHMIREIKLFTGVTPARLRVAEGDLGRMIDERARLSGVISPLTSET